MNTLNLEISQKLHMTQQLAQAVKILAMSGQEINDLVDKQVLENPVLELESPPNIDDRWSGISHTPSADKDAFYSLARQKKSLQDSLTEQAFLVISDTEDKKIAEYIIGSLNESGYLEQTPNDIATKFSCTIKKVEHVRSIIKDLDPVGFASLNISEYLLLQIEHLPEQSNKDLAASIIKDHLANLSKNDFESIAIATDHTEKEIQNAVKLIKTLSPRPINTWIDQSEVQYIVPDILIEKVKNDYIVSLNPLYTRTLKIQDEYTGMRKSVDKDTKKYISKNLSSAKWLIYCLQQREKNIRKISETLVDLQKDFLENGFIYMKPLNMKTIAQMLEMHESTVSRTINGKYAQTPQGTIALKEFFPSGLTTISGNKLSTAQIKKRIADIIAEYGKVSDQKILSILKDEGINIARRTIAKYRAQLGIKSSFDRKP